MLRQGAIVVSCCVGLCGCEPPPGAYDPKPPSAAVPLPTERPNLPPPAATRPGATPGDAPVVRAPIKADRSSLDPYQLLSPASALRTRQSVEEQLVFEVQIPKAMQIFEGVRNRKPTSHQEFMTEIIQKNGIRLPPLPPQHRYIYDVERGELMVESPQVAD